LTLCSALSSALSTLQAETEQIRFSLTQTSSTLQSTQSDLETLQAQLRSTQSLLTEAEAVVSRLESEARDRSTSSEANDRELELVERIKDCEELRENVVKIQKEKEGVLDERNHIENELIKLEIAMGEREEELTGVIGERQKRLEGVLIKLQEKEDEVLRLSQSLQDAGSPLPASSHATPTAVTMPASSSTRTAPRLSDEELAGIQRMQDAVTRLRGERDALVRERTQLKLSLNFSVSRPSLSTSLISSY
jgi:vacuolar-type H+-ATPase subunit I/STV1